MSDPPKLAFGFKKPLPKSSFLSSAPAAKKAVPSKPSAFSAFGSQDDDEAPPPPPLASTSALSRPGAAKVSTATLSRAQKAKQKEELEMDKSVYEYDEVFDKMKEGARLAESEKKKDAGERKPKYISKLMETAETRKRDRIRAEDKMVQREREMEGEEFKDKDQFVTPSYLAQQEELRRIEEEEKKKDEANTGKGGMASFLKSYLDKDAAAHEAAVAATLAKPSSSDASSAPSFTIEAPKEKSEAEIAKDFEKATGKKIEVNDDGIIIDKRELLSGGLNIVKKATASSSSSGFSAPISARAATSSSSINGSTNPLHGNQLSAAERGKQSRERHSREVERQMMELESKRKREAEEQLEEKVKKVAKRNDETKVEKLKREAEERRKKREEEAKAATAGGT